MPHTEWGSSWGAFHEAGCFSGVVCETSPKKWCRSWDASHEVGYFVGGLPQSGVVRGMPPTKLGWFISCLPRSGVALARPPAKWDSSCNATYDVV